jgi:hypothetical protein
MPMRQQRKAAQSQITRHIIGTVSVTEELIPAKK